MMHPRFSSKLAQILEISPEALTDATVLGAVEWDSIGVLDLIAAMDEAYGVSISTGAIYSASTLGDLRTLMRAAGAEV